MTTLQQMHSESLGQEPVTPVHTNPAPLNQGASHLVPNAIRSRLSSYASELDDRERREMSYSGARDMNQSYSSQQHLQVDTSYGGPHHSHHSFASHASSPRSTSGAYNAHNVSLTNIHVATAGQVEAELLNNTGNTLARDGTMQHNGRHASTDEVFSSNTIGSNHLVAQPGFVETSLSHSPTGGSTYRESHSNGNGTLLLKNETNHKVAGVGSVSGTLQRGQMYSTGTMMSRASSVPTVMAVERKLYEGEVTTKRGQGLLKNKCFVGTVVLLFILMIAAIVGVVIYFVTKKNDHS